LKSGLSRIAPLAGSRPMEVNFGGFATDEFGLFQYHVIFHCARITPFDKAIEPIKKAKI
jgi:hypothetical protein